MDKLFKCMLRLWSERRKAVREKRRISALVDSSNCIGTTYNLFQKGRSGVSAGDLKAVKKPDGNRA